MIGFYEIATSHADGIKQQYNYTWIKLKYGERV